jgi:hypothetical protein
MMPRTYEPIASQTLGSDTATVSFTSIPQTYTDLIIVAMSGSSGTDSSLLLRINTNSGNTLHSRTMLDYRSSLTSARVSNDSVFRMANRIDDGTPTTTSIAQIMCYANTNVYKTALFANACAGKEVGRFVGLWSSTDAITAIYLFADPGLNLKSGSRFSLFGIKAA